MCLEQINQNIPRVFMELIGRLPIIITHNIPINKDNVFDIEYPEEQIVLPPIGYTLSGTFTNISATTNIDGGKIPNTQIHI